MIMLWFKILIKAPFMFQIILYVLCTKMKFSNQLYKNLRLTRFIVLIISIRYFIIIFPF